MSRETTEARALSRQARSGWLGHLGSCPRCATARDRRRPRDRCEAGADLYRDAMAAAREVTRNVQEDRAPLPGQTMLPGFGHARYCGASAVHGAHDDCPGRREP